MPTTATLLPVVMLLSLGTKRTFAFLGLCHFVGLVLATLLAESPVGFRNVHHGCEKAIGTERYCPVLMRSLVDSKALTLVPSC